VGATSDGSIAEECRGNTLAGVVRKINPTERAHSEILKPGVLVSNCLMELEGVGIAQQAWDRREGELTLVLSRRNQHAAVVGETSLWEASCALEKSEKPHDKPRNRSLRIPENRPQKGKNREMDRNKKAQEVDTIREISLTHAPPCQKENGR